MIQQINLYQGFLNKNQSTSTTNKHIFSLALIPLLFLGFSAFLLANKNNTKENIQIAQQQLSDAELEVEQLQIQFPEKQVDPLITQEITRQKKIISSLSEVVYLLSDNKSDQTQGFSKYFSALAKQSISDVWLTNININAEEKNLSIQGSTFNTEKFPVFLQKLHHEAVFNGRTFSTMTVLQAKEMSNRLDFKISTIAIDSKKS